jgi:DNA-binding MarR family transcriptional regulator
MWLCRRTMWLYGRTMSPAADEFVAIQEALVNFVRAFGLHQPDRTPCGQPMTASEAHALTELGRDGPLRQIALGRRLRLEKSTISRLVSLLAERGWLERIPSSEDGRGVLLSLTDEGRKTAAAITDARFKKFAALLESIPADRRTDVLAALHTLTEALDAQR